MVRLLLLLGLPSLKGDRVYNILDHVTESERIIYEDLDPETVRRIEDATRKIGNALNVTGPFNIQFIAKANEIKVIECNVRASRSFPFVSKVMGVDLIEMATKAMAGLPLVEYPPTTIPPDYVGVKVPQFSFSRLSGADPVLQRNVY